MACGGNAGGAARAADSIQIPPRQTGSASADLARAASLAAVATPIAIFGSGNFIAMLSAFIPGFFGLVFIVMYGFCLKEMK